MKIWAWQRLPCTINLTAAMVLMGVSVGKLGRNLLFWGNAVKSLFQAPQFWLVCYQLTHTLLNPLKVSMHTAHGQDGCSLESGTMWSPWHRLSHCLLTAMPGAHAVVLYWKPKFKEGEQLPRSHSIKGDTGTHSRRLLRCSYHCTGVALFFVTQRKDEGSVAKGEK